MLGAIQTQVLIPAPRIEEPVVRSCPGGTSVPWQKDPHDPVEELYPGRPVGGLLPPDPGQKAVDTVNSGLRTSLQISWQSHPSAVSLLTEIRPTDL